MNRKTNFVHVHATIFKNVRFPVTIHKKVRDRVRRNMLMTVDTCVLRFTDFPENSVWCLSGVRILSEFVVRYLSVRILYVAILSGVRILSRFSEKVCPVSVCPAGQGHDRGVRIFTVAVHLTLISTGTRKTIRKNLA